MTILPQPVRAGTATLKIANKGTNTMELMQPCQSVDFSFAQHQGLSWHYPGQQAGFAATPDPTSTTSEPLWQGTTDQLPGFGLMHPHFQDGSDFSWFSPDALDGSNDIWIPETVPDTGVQIPITKSGDPSTTSAGTAYPDVPCAVISELIELYFIKIHHFVPIIHRPRFYEKYAFTPFMDSAETVQSALGSSLLLNCVMALAARFSQSPCLGNCPASEKGIQFGNQAADIYYKSLRAPPKSPLEHLQGCILFAFYMYLSGPTTEGWLVIGTCVRLAYDMSLDRTDMSVPSFAHEPSGWTHKEELRRAWWSTWELDTFSAAVACRRHAIDQRSFQVKLPVSDTCWFADREVQSAIIDPDALHAWHALRDCENQDERAWSLVGNYLLLMAQDMAQQPTINATDVAVMDSAVVCYSLLLPEKFQVRILPATGSAEEEKTMQRNWILTANMMLQSLKIFVKFLSETVPGPKLGSSSQQLIAPLAAGGLFEVQTSNYRCFTDEVLRIIKAWPPEYLSCCYPFVGCLFIGPAAIHARVIAHDIFLRRNKAQEQSEMEILRLALSRIARYWKFGALLVDLIDSVAASHAHTYSISGLQVL